MRAAAPASLLARALVRALPRGTHTWLFHEAHAGPRLLESGSPYYLLRHIQNVFDLPAPAAAGAAQQRDAVDTESEPAAASKSLLMQVRSWRQATRAGDTQVRAAALLKYPRLGGSSESTKSEGEIK